MAATEKVSVSLTSEFTALINEAVSSGEYASASEVIREALRDWKQKRVAQLQHIDELRQLWDEGIASGPGRYSSIEEMKQAARLRVLAETPAG